MTKARDLSKLLSTANGKIAGANLDVSFENISDTGTAGTKVASGTTLQRGSTAGQIRFNTTIGLAEYYDGTNFKSIDSPPTVTAVSPLEVDSTAGGNITFTITGSNFQSGAVAKFIGNDATEITASTTTINSGSSISAIIARSSFVGAKEPYDVRVINTSGLSGTLDNQINVDVSPAWSTASGTLATIYDDATGTHATVSATDADGDTVSYSETGGTVLTTAGLTLNSSTGAISGNPTNVASDTTYSFTLRATANSKTVDRAFNIIVGIKDGSTSAKANTSAVNIYNLGITTNGYYYINLDGTVRQIYCDMTNGGFMLLSHWSENTNNSGSPSVGSTSYASSVGGYTGANNTAVSQPDTANDLYNNYGSLTSSTPQSGSWQWDSSTRGLGGGGSWYRNSTNASGKIVSYRPNNYGYSWTHCKYGFKVIGGGSLDEFNGGYPSINDAYVDGISVTSGSSTSRTHHFTVAINGGPSGGGGGSSPQGFIGGNSQIISSLSNSDISGNFNISSTNIPPELRISSDQDTSNEDIYIRAFYIFLK